jgi:pyruvate,water dikinase
MVYVRWLDTLRVKDVPIVGGKNASLGEMVGALKGEGIQVPDGFATTADAYWEFLKINNLEKQIARLVKRPGGGKEIRKLLLKGKFSEAFCQQITKAYAKLDHADVAVRSSATAEDLPDASFAGQQETFLNVRGTKALLEACKKCYASLFTDRAISYRNAKGFDHLKIALSIGVQKMVRSDLASSGVLFTLDTETGFRKVIVINAAWGLGENVVQGTITPDEYVVFKPLLSIIEKTLGEKEQKMIYFKESVKNVKTTKKEQTSFVLEDKEIKQLAKWALAIEKHYGRPMDIEWAKDGKTGKLFIVQARPETVHSQKQAGAFKTYRLKEKGKVLCQGLAIGEAIASGKAQVIRSISQIGKFKEGSFLVTQMTSPDWVPIMEKAAGIITDHGGRTSHAAIVSRELGLPALVGTGKATTSIKDGQEITLSCAEGEHGFVYAGSVPFDEEEISLEDIPKIKTQILMNIASPIGAFRWWRLPCQGIGLARMEFIINNIIQIHPMALVHFERVKDPAARKQIQKLTQGYADKSEYFVDHLAQGIAKIAASRYPDPVIVRLSDFKTNEYANLIGGAVFEPKEENPMLGFRGASRYYSPRYKEGFALECRALKRVREKMGLDNVLIMIPFCRTLEEADKVLQVLAENGLKRHEKGLEIYVMCEIPSNVILAEQFADKFDGFSIGSNDLTQLILGVDRDSAELAPLFDERNPAVKKMIQEVISAAKKKRCKVGICGQAPSDHPEFAEFLVRSGIDSISLNPDSIVSVIQRLSKLERNKEK